MRYRTIDFSAICSIIIDFSHCSSIHVYVADLFLWFMNSYCKFHFANSKFSTSLPVSNLSKLFKSLMHSLPATLGHKPIKLLSCVPYGSPNMTIISAMPLQSHQVTGQNQPACREWLQAHGDIMSHITLLPTFYKTQSVSSLWMCKSHFFTHNLPIVRRNAITSLFSNYKFLWAYYYEKYSIFALDK